MTLKIESIFLKNYIKKCPNKFRGAFFMLLSKLILLFRNS